MRDLVDAEAEDSDYEILTADYSQLELRIAAWLFPEHNMRKLYQEGADLHRTSAAYMIAKRVGRTPEQFWRKRKYWEGRVTKDERQAAKGENFGLLYGMQEPHFASYVEQNYGVKLTAQQAHDTYEEHFKLYEGLRPAHERVIAEAEKRGYTLTPFGRYRYETEATKVINTPIQSTGSDFGVFAVTLIFEEFERQLAAADAQLVGFIHDAVIVRSRKDKRAEVSAIITQAMEHPPLERVGIAKIPVPLVAEVAAGPTWAQAK
jgi:DNA polymerase-1